MRPSVDVVVPFAGPRDSLERTATTLSAIDLGAYDTLVIADNTPDAAPRGERLARATVIPALGVRSSYFARNRGAASGQNEWLLFLDADVVPPPDLIERYFAVTPADGTAVLVGAVRDLAPDETGRAPASVRYAYLRAFIDQEGTMTRPEWAYAKTASCAVRRRAFEAVGGFRDDIRSGGDADLCFRLKEAGWRLEWRREAEVMHRSRETIRRFLQQRAKHGSGAEWLNRRYPGFSPRSSWRGLARSSASRLIAGTRAAVRGDRDEMLLSFLDAAGEAAFRVGRLVPNTVHTPRQGTSNLTARSVGS